MVFPVSKDEEITRPNSVDASARFFFTQRGNNEKYAIIENELSKIVSIGSGSDIDFYKKIGMTEIEVEQAYDGTWYVAGYAPAKPQELINNEEIQKLKNNLMILIIRSLNVVNIH